MHQIASGVSFLHSNEVIHRALATENLSVCLKTKPPSLKVLYSLLYMHDSMTSITELWPQKILASVWKPTLLHSRLCTFNMIYDLGIIHKLLYRRSIHRALAKEKHLSENKTSYTYLFPKWMNFVGRYYPLMNNPWIILYSIIIPRLEDSLWPSIPPRKLFLLQRKHPVLPSASSTSSIWSSEITRIGGIWCSSAPRKSCLRVVRDMRRATTSSQWASYSPRFWVRSLNLLAAKYMHYSSP